jgi:hypothetical protein
MVYTPHVSVAHSCIDFRLAGVLKAGNLEIITIDGQRRCIDKSDEGGKARDTKTN